MNINIPLILTTVLVLALGYLGWLQFKTVNKKIQALSATVTSLQENMKTLQATQSNNVNFDIKNIDSLIEKYENELHETNQENDEVTQNNEYDEEDFENLDEESRDDEEEYYEENNNTEQTQQLETDFNEIAEVEEVQEDENDDDDDDDDDDDNDDEDIEYVEEENLEDVGGDNLEENASSHKISLDLTHPDNSEIKVIVSNELEKIKKHYSKKTKNELKNILKTYNKSLTGSKDTLISRILEVDQLKNINI